MRITIMGVVAAFLLAVFCLGIVPSVAAEEKGIEVNTSLTMKQILETFAGKRVALRTDAGESLEGTVTSVGDHIVHISKLSGKDYYDAVVVIDRITSVVFRARGK